MKIHRDVKQGTDEWRALRLGILTASNVERILTPKTLEPSKSMGALVAELVAERVLGCPCDDTQGEWLDRGTTLEPRARNDFMFHYEPVEQVGFLSTDDGRFGASPDGIVEGRFGYEAKCPSAKVHVGYLMRPEDFDLYVRLQVQSGLWLTGWPMWYAHSYCSGFPSLVRETEPDAKVHAALDKHVPAVAAAVESALARIEEMRVEAGDPAIDVETRRQAAIIFG